MYICPYMSMYVFYLVSSNAMQAEVSHFLFQPIIDVTDMRIIKLVLDIPDCSCKVLNCYRPL
jgi:hypothetical protein